jgi:hypothetical protein
VFWRPEVLPDVVRLHPAGGGDAACLRYDPGQWPGRLDRFADDDGLLLILSAGGAEHRLWLAAEPAPGTPLAVMIGLDPHAPARAEAALCLWRHLCGRAEPRRPARPPPRVQRLARALQALDGRMAGASYREIALVLFGEARLREAGYWRTSHLRDAAVGLVATGRALMAGGYRRLLLSSLR